MNGREALLYDLLRASRPIDELSRELAAFGWDSEEELATLDRPHVVAILTDYLAGRRTASEVRAWAEAIEGRDDIGMAGDSEAMLRDTIFRLANPELDHALSPLLAQKLLRELQA